MLSMVISLTEQNKLFTALVRTKNIRVLTVVTNCKLDRVKWIPHLYDMALTQVPDGGGGLQIMRVVTKTPTKHRRKPTGVVPPVGGCARG